MKFLREQSTLRKIFIHATHIVLLLAIFVSTLRNTILLGPTWDDWYYPESLAKQISLGTFMFDGDYESFASGYGLGSITFLEFVVKIFTLDFNTEIDTSLDALFYRRVVQIVLAVIAGYLLVSIFKFLGFEKGIRWLAPLLLITLPNWIGQGGINVKDIPVAVGLLFIIDSFFRIIDSKGIGKKSLYGILEGVLGIHLSFGTRFGLFMFILISLLWLYTMGKRPLGKDFKAVQKKILTTLFFGYLLLIPLNPILLNPLKVAYYSTFGTLSLFNLPAGPVLTANQLLDGNNPPFWYLPAWSLVQMPLTHIILLIGGITLLIASLRPSIFLKKKPKNVDLFQAKLMIFLTLTIGPYLVAIGLRPPLYDGDRQFLMAYPFFIYLMLTFLRAIQAKLKDKKRKTILILLAISILASPGYSLIKIAPFTYTFRNELIPNPNQWEGDYSGVSIRMAVSKFVSKEDALAFDFSDERWLVNVNRKDTQIMKNEVNSGYVFVASRRGVRQSIPLGCRPLEGISTEVFGRENVLTFVAICPSEDMRKK